MISQWGASHKRIRSRVTVLFVSCPHQSSHLSLSPSFLLPNTSPFTSSNNTFFFHTLSHPSLSFSTKRSALLNINHHGSISLPSSSRRSCLATVDPFLDPILCNSCCRPFISLSHSITPRRSPEFIQSQLRSPPSSTSPAKAQSAQVLPRHPTLSPPQLLELSKHSLR